MTTKILWISAAIAISSVGIFFRNHYNKSEVTAVHSCVLSVQAELPAFEKEIQPQFLEMNRWNVLSGKNYDTIISGLILRSSLDCFRFRQKGRLIDPWGHELQIAVRPLQNGNVDFAVWSNGPDGVSKTADDILSQPIE